ncbi:MAG TPA: TrkA family potassium uptake protein [Egicoccus sp.]|nr:TrkA family potassium uptake protein [Egicoccus sp.]HSK23186.1 TrkA family potassium uptake protein [Egicoccus sp.]
MRIVVLGCGRVGAGLAAELDSRGASVAAVDHDAAALARLPSDFSGASVLGSVLDRDVLRRAGIERADAAAVVTGDDAVNAVVALHCRRTLGVPQVVARLYDPARAELTRRLEIRTLSPVTWGIQGFADILRPDRLHTVTRLGTGDVEVTDVRVPGLLGGRTAAELEVAGETRVVAITRHGRTVLATAATPLEAEDVVHVAVGTAARGRLESLLG